MQTPTTGPAKDANTSIKNDFAAMTLTLHDKFLPTLAGCSGTPY